MPDNRPEAAVRPKTQVGARWQHVGLEYRALLRTSTDDGAAATRAPMYGICAVSRTLGCMTHDPARVDLDGPWSCAFAVRVPLALRSKSNFRRHRGRVADAGSWETAQNFERSLGVVVRSVRPSDWVVGERTTALAERPVVVAFLAARSTLDVANYSKSILDACENVLYVTDASVLGVSCLGARGRGDEMLLGFAQLAPGTAPDAVNEALQHLSAAALASFPDVV